MPDNRIAKDKYTAQLSGLTKVSFILKNLIIASSGEKIILVTIVQSVKMKTIPSIAWKNIRPAIVTSAARTWKKSEGIIVANNKRAIAGKLLRKLAQKDSN